MIALKNKVFQIFGVKYIHILCKIRDNHLKVLVQMHLLIFFFNLHFALSFDF